MLRWLVLALALLGGARPACAAFINGHSYVPMTDWAEANGLKLLWDQRSGQVRVSNASLRLGFQEQKIGSQSHHPSSRRMSARQTGMRQKCQAAGFFAKCYCRRCYKISTEINIFKNRL